MRFACPIFCTILALTLLGCYEEEVTIEIRENGSVRLHQVTHASERLIVASQESEERSPTIVSEEKMRATLEAAGARILRLSATPQGDGSLVLEAISEFDRPADFFLSDYARDDLSVNLTEEGEGMARLHMSSGSKSKNVDVSLRQLYGLAKGLYIKRTVRLPSEIVKSGDASVIGKRTASLEFDLRNRQALERMEKITDNAGRQTLYVVFRVDPKKFPLPLEKRPAEAGAVKGAPAALSDYDLSVKSLAWEKVKTFIGDDSAFFPDLEIEFRLSWPKGKGPQAVYHPEISRAVDDTGKDLTGKLYRGETRKDVDPHDGAKDIRVRLDTPKPGAREIRVLEGKVPIVTGASRETVTLDNPGSYLGKDSTGIAALDGLGFKITKFEHGRVKIRTGDGKSKNVQRLVLIDSEGERITYSSLSTMNDALHYDFPGSLEDVVKAEVEVITGERVKEMPFRIEGVALP